MKKIKLSKLVGSSEPLGRLMTQPIPSDVRQDEKIQRLEDEIIRLRDAKGS